jgi:hypothetical protein
MLISAVALAAQAGFAAVFAQPVYSFARAIV